MHKVLKTGLMIAILGSLCQATYKQFTIGNDAHINDKSADDNYGGSSTLYLGYITTEALANRGPYRIVINFPIDDTLPSDAVIDSADLALYCSGEDVASPESIWVYHLLQDWLEGSADGAEQDGAVSWNSNKHNVSTWDASGAATAGTDRGASAYDSVVINATSTWFKWRVTGAAQDWVDGDLTNYGLILEGTEADDLRKNFNSLDAGSNKPYLDVWYRVLPVITGLSSGANATGDQEDTSTVNISYEVSDSDDDNVTITAQYQVGGAGGWTALTNTSGDIGSVEANSSSSDRVIVWDAYAQLGSGIDSSYIVRAIATDDEGYADTVSTSSFVIDTRDPVSLADFTVVDSGFSTVDLEWTVASEAHFSKYEIWYGTNLTNVEERNVSAYVWDPDDYAVMNTISTDSAQVILLEYNTKYYFKLWAIDSTGNEMTTDPDSANTLTSVVPLITGWDPIVDPVAVQINTDSVQVKYEAWDQDDSAITVTMEMKLKDDASWTAWADFKANTDGDTGSVAVDMVEDLSVYWDVRTQFGSTDTTAYIRILAEDDGSNIDTAATAEFIIDTEVPSFSATLSSTDTTMSTVALSWSSAATDGNFNHYEVWYGIDSTSVQNRSNAAEWDNDPDDSNLASAATTSTTITGLLAERTYYFQVWAMDDYGNETAINDTAVTTLAETDADSVVQLTDLDDNMIENLNTSYNYGNDATRGGATAGKVGSGGGGSYVMRSLVKVNDFSDVPTGATVLLAEFKSYCGSVGSATNQTITLYRVLRDWNEGTGTGQDQANMSNWTEYADENTWTTAGVGSEGNDRSASVVSASVGNTGWYTWDITQTFKDWHSGDSANYGMVFISNAEGTNESYKNFHASEGANVPYVEVTYVLYPPQVTGLGATSTVTASQDETDSATIQYEVYDQYDATVTVTLQYKPDGGSWTAATDTAGNIGAGVDATNEYADRTIRWSVRDQLGDAIDGTYYVRVIASDGGLADTAQSAAFGLDTKSPVGLADFAVVDPLSTSVSFSWTALSDEGHFDHYEIWYGSSKSEVENRNGSALEWDGDNNNGMKDIATTSMIVTGLSPSTKYHFKIWAVDAMNNEATITGDSTTTLDDPAPTVTGWDQAAQVDAEQIDSGTVRVGYEVSDDNDTTAVCSLQYCLASSCSWTNPSTLSGDYDTISTGASIDDTLQWDVYTDLIPGTTDAAYNVRVHCIDDDSNTDTTVSGSFDIDLVDPSGLAGLTVGATNATDVGLSWTVTSSESHFSHYEIWYGTSQSDVQGRTGTALEWDQDNDASLATMATDTTNITSLIPSSTYYFKIWALDSMGNEDTDTDVNTTTLATNDPVVTGWDDAPYVNAAQYHPDSVRVGYEVDDANDGTVDIKVEYKLYGGSWDSNDSLETTSGDIGTGIDTSATGNDTILWDVDTDLPNTDTVYLVRVIATDGSSNRDTTESDTFAIDTKIPAGLASLAGSDSTGTTVTLGWTAATDRNFDHYEIWYGTTLAEARDSSGTEWDDGDDGALTSAATTSTTITGLSINTLYYFKIWAFDAIGNGDSTASIDNYTKNMVAAAWSKTGLGPVQGGAITENRIYIGTGSGVNRLFSYNLSDGQQKWFFSTSAYGACNMPTYVYDTDVSKYKIFASAGEYVIGRQDDISSSSEVFTPLDLNATAGNPYASPDDSTFFITYTNYITRYNYINDSTMSGWPVNLADVSLSADLVVKNDEIYVATATGGGGYVYKYDYDGTQTGAGINMGTDVQLPLLVDRNTLYVTPATSSLYAITISTWSFKWSPTSVNLGTANTGPAFIMGKTSDDTANTGDIYVAVENNVKKVSDNGSGIAATVDWAYDALDTVNAAPLPWDTVVYFGRQGGRYYAIDDNASSAATMTNWPYSDASDDADAGPWISEDAGLVIFGTAGGNLDAFTLE
ncbi:DNRLRE domain-containing protein [Fibrobacterota bacterium]